MATFWLAVLKSTMKAPLVKHQQDQPTRDMTKMQLAFLIKSMIFIVSLLLLIPVVYI